MTPTFPRRTRSLLRGRCWNEWPQNIPQSEAKKFPTRSFPPQGWPRNCHALMAGKELPERSSIALHHQGNNHHETSNTQFLTILISWYWICDIRYMIYDVWYMMWLYYLYDIWYVMHMLICSSPTITLCRSHLRWVGMPDMGRLGFSRWVTSKKSFNFFWISPWFTHHETEASRVRNDLPSIFKSSSTL